MPRTGFDEVAFVTGFPSFFARRVLEHLVEVETGTYVYALVRADERDAAHHALEALAADHRARIELVEGDPAAMDLGLSGSEFGALAAEIDWIYQAAFDADPSIDRKQAERVNLNSAFEILELSRACTSLKRLVFYSTTQVAGDCTGLVRERDLELGQKFPNVVAETRARAEKVVRKAMQDVPAAVIRPSLVVGDSRTGEIDRLDGPYLFVLLILTSPPDLAIPLPAPADAPLNMVPIDYVVRAAHALGRHPGASGNTFHIVDPKPLSARRVFEIVAQACERPPPRGNLPPNLARTLLRTPGLDRFVKSPRAFLDLLSTEVRYDNAHASELLEGTGIECPTFESYARVLVDHVRERIRERRESKHPPAGSEPLAQEPPSTLDGTEDGPSH